MAQYFSNTRRGELSELQDQLNSNKLVKKKDAVKKIIAAMTIGQDVSASFPHVVKCMETDNLELKKLVYLYIINYAKSQPDLAILAVNSFRKDARNPVNPLIRALAVRTMGCIRVERIMEYLCEPLKDALNDEDAYVRKTAAICVAKLYDSVPELVEDSDLIGILRSMLSDGNAMVVSNSCRSLMEISEIKGSPAIQLTSVMVMGVLAALNEATEWGQIYIMDYLAFYTPQDASEAESIIERIVPRMAHSNHAVVLSAVKILMKMMDFCSNSETIRTISRRLAPNLVTLMTGEPEIQFISLRAINLIIQKRPTILEREVKVFFCKYDDPIYVKLEKLEIMVKLADAKNIDSILHELKEYSSEVDVDFVKRSVRAIGRCAIKLDRAVERCVTSLLDLIHMKVNYVVQEAIIVIRDIFRKYPNRFEGIIPELFENLNDLSDPEAKASMIWIIGEYADRIEDSAQQLYSFYENFKEDPPNVQLVLLTAVVKLFIKRPDEAEGFITALFETCTQEIVNPDVRDRAYFYWRMLSTDPEAAKDIIMADKPIISDEVNILEGDFLDYLIERIGTLSSIYQKPAEAVATRYRQRVYEREEIEENVEFDSQGAQIGTFSPVVENTYEIDLLELGERASIIQGVPAVIPAQIFLTAETPGTNQQTGLMVSLAFQRQNKEIVLQGQIGNNSSLTLDNFQLALNTNSYGLAAPPDLPIEPIEVGHARTFSVALNTWGTPSQQAPGVPFMVQIAVKCNLDVFYFQAPCMYTALLVESGAMQQQEFSQMWGEIGEDGTFSYKFDNVLPEYDSGSKVKFRFEANNIFLVSQRQENETDIQYYSTTDVRGFNVLCQLTISINEVTMLVKAKSSALAGLFIQSTNFLLGTSYQNSFYTLKHIKYGQLQVKILRPSSYNE